MKKDNWKSEERRESFKRLAAITGVFVVMMVSVGPPMGAVGQAEAQSGGVILEDFEDGDVSDWDYPDDVGLTSVNPIEGDYSASPSQSPEFNVEKPLPAEKYNNLTAKLRLESSSGTKYIGYYYSVENHRIQYRISGARLEVSTSSGYQDTGLDFNTGEVYTLHTSNIDYSNNTHSVDVYNETGAIVYDSPTFNVQPFSYFDVLLLDSQSDSITVDSFVANQSVDFDGGGVEGTTDTIKMEVDRYMKHGSSQYYNVSLTSLNTTTNQTTRQEVTENSTVLVENGTLLTLYESNNTLVATSDVNLNDRTNVTAYYENETGFNLSDTVQVTVANETVDNLEILPPIQRVTASLGDDTILLILIATMAGIIGTRIATSFAGLAFMEMTFVVGWFAGYASVGMAMVSVFICLFIGLNLAANIDYSVRR